MLNTKPRTHLLLSLFFASILVNACGGGGSDGGISGTGITMGRITQFGSIYVNGIRFNVDNARFLRDGTSAAGQQEFSIGEYVVINGTINTASKTGVAQKVTFRDVLEGSVTLASTDNVNIEVLGQRITTDATTVFHGVTQLTDFVAGNIVEVSGIKDANGLVLATSIKLKQDDFVEGVSENEIKGTISSLNTTDKTLMINNILVKYATAILEGFNGQPQNGQFIEVKSNMDIIGNTLIASKIELENEYQDVTANSEIELEGVVTRFVSLSDFDVNGIAVTTTQNTRYKQGTAADVALNILLEVEGKVNAEGVLVAEKIEIEEYEDEHASPENNNDTDNN
jgi:hypothetical protein